jgi:hypothetical protein
MLNITLILALLLVIIAFVIHPSQYLPSDSQKGQVSGQSTP